MTRPLDARDHAAHQTLRELCGDVPRPKWEDIHDVLTLTIPTSDVGAVDADLQRAADAIMRLLTDGPAAVDAADARATRDALG